MKIYSFRKIFFLSALLSLIFSVPFAEAAPKIRIAVIDTTKDEELAHVSEILTDNLTGTLAKSEAITLVERAELDLIMREKKINAANLHSTETAEIGNLTGCQYLLLTSLVYYASPIINARIVEAATSDIVYSETEISETEDNTSMIAASSRMADKVLSVLAGEQAVITEVKSDEVIINRGSFQGVRNGDLYRVFMGTKRNPVNVAVVRVKDTRGGFSTAEILKNGGHIEALRKSDKVEAVSQTEANSLIKSKKFVKKRIGEKEAANPTMTALESLYKEPMQEFNKFFEICEQSNDAIIKKRETVFQQDPETQKYVMKKNDAKFFNEIGEECLALGLAHLHHSRNNTLYTAYNNLETIKTGLSFSPKERAEKLAQREEELAAKCFELAKLWFEFAAKRRNLDAINNLGVLYTDGLGVEKDLKKAFEYFNQAAAENDPVALDNLGNTYLLGLGIEKDYAKALELFSKSAEKGCVNALADLGFMYSQGFGVKQDYKKAVEFFRKAADKGNAFGITALGDMYARGTGVPQDFRKAIKLFRQAAAYGVEGDSARKELKALGAN